MSPASSTFRSALDATVGDGTGPLRRTILHQRVAEEWQTADPDLVTAIERHPQLLVDRSFLLNLAIEEFRSRRQRQSGLDLEHHCRRFRRFGSSIERSIFRQLETQQFIDDHPELLALLGEPKWPALGESFVGFEILEELGAGGIARVYLCREPDVGNRLVVLKTTPFGGFEASVLGRLNHPNIVPIHSTGVSDAHGLQYLCMPYRGRSTLADLIDMAFQAGVPRDDRVLAAAAGRWLPAHEAASQPSASWLSRGLAGFLLRLRGGRGRESVATGGLGGPAERPVAKDSRPRAHSMGSGTYVGGIVKIGLQLADALAYAHELGILHGDLKPSNVLLTTDARPLLLDFNLSQDREAVETLCGGTLAYMPPEHLRRLAASASASEGRPPAGSLSDVYSFGALLYELLAGVTPVVVRRDVDEPADVAAALLEQLQQGVPTLRRYNPFVSRRLDALVRRCLALDPADRPASMEEIKQALARELRLAPSAGRQIRRRPLLWASMLAGFVGTGAASAVYWANRPPLHLLHYQRAGQYAQAGDAEKAVQAYSAALAAMPSFREALFARGRARVALGELDLATSDFTELVRDHDDPASMAYLGYCFNLLGDPRAAIAWYERALEQGAESGAVYNNLGASYILARGQLSREERYQRAEQCLSVALEHLELSDVVHLNVLRLETVRSSEVPSRNPARAWRHAEAVLSLTPDDPFIRSRVALWYAAVVNWEASATKLGSIQRPSTAEEIARRRFAKLIMYAPRSAPSDRSQHVATARQFANTEPDSTSRRFYIEPDLD